LNKSYAELARHYGTTIIAARPGKPKDKGSDENMVGIVSRRIIAKLRDCRFSGVHEINLAIAEQLNILINRPFQKMEGNRITAFEKIDQPCLRPLPAVRFEHAEWKETKVQFNYHVDFSGFFYSVSYVYINRKCSIRATSTTIEVFIGTERIAAHARNYNTLQRYVTLPEHMPENHKAVTGWTSERFLSWAEKTGPNTREFIKRVLDSREYQVQTYRTCMGIMRFEKIYPAQMMEDASREAIDRNACSYKYFSLILKHIQQQMPVEPAAKIIPHDNVRGSSAYIGGGIHA